MSNSAVPRAFLKNVMQNGMGRYICQLQRVTIKFCKESPGSVGTRDFIEQHLLDFTRANPGVVVYLKPHRHRPPRLVGEYLNGRQEAINTNLMEAERVCKWLEHLRTRSGVQIVNLSKHWQTHTPSVQGVWHPFYNKNPALAATSFPAADLYRKEEELTATEMVLKEAGVKRLGSIDDVSTKE